MSHPMQLWEGFDLPDTVVTQAIAVLARRGAGKSYLATKLAGLMCRAGHQIVAVDPVGVWWGLRVSSDGTTSSGLPIIVLGGRRGDLSLSETDGRRIAELVVEQGISVVLDVSGFETQAAMRRFVADFAEALFERRKARPFAPMHVFLEEAQEFAPQRPRPDATRMLGNIERLVKIGRNYRIGVTMVSQRPQAVNKDVLTQAELLVLLQIAGEHERKALRAWMDEKGEDTKKLLGELPGLARGEAMVWSPSWLKIRAKVKIPPKDTYDTSSSEDAASVAPAVRHGTVELDLLIDGLRKALEATEEPPKRKRNAIPPPKPGEPPYTSSRQAIGAAVDRAREQRTTAPAPGPRSLKAIHEDLLALAARLGTIGNELAMLAIVGEGERRRDASNGQIRGALTDTMPATEPRTFFLNERHELPRRDTRPVVGRGVSKHRCDGQPDCAMCRLAKEVEGGAPGPDHLGRAARRLLEQLVRWSPVALTRAQLATQAGFSPKSGTYRNALSQLRVGGYVIEGLVGDRTLLGVSQKGLGLFEGQTIDTVRPDRVRDAWAEKLAAAPSRCFEVLCRAWPASITREELAVRAHLAPTSGTFRNALSRLRVNGLIDPDVRSPDFRAAPALFLKPPAHHPTAEEVRS